MHCLHWTALLASLARSLARSLQTRSLCAVFLRQRLVRGEPLRYDALPDPLQRTIRDQLLRGLVSETDRGTGARRAGSGQCGQ